MAAQWPRVKAWLVATIPTLPGLSDVQVYPGPPVTSSTPRRYVTVGYVAGEKGGSYQQQQFDDGTVWQEMGDVQSHIVAGVGDSDSSVAEGMCFAIADALESSIRADRRLGGLIQEGSVESIVEIDSIANQQGTATALIFTLRYTTVT